MKCLKNISETVYSISFAPKKCPIEGIEEKGFVQKDKGTIKEILDTIILKNKFQILQAAPEQL